MADTTQVTNISGVDRDVKLPSGQWLTVAAGATAEFDATLAEQLVQQTDNWEAAKPAPRTAAKAATGADAADSKE